MSSKKQLVLSLCQLFLELEKAYEALQGVENSIKRSKELGTISDFRYELDMEDVRRQYKRLAGAFIRLRCSYDLVRLS